MNNFGNENIGSLLHKLTKYQTLNANCGSPSKSAVYNQKIAYYSNKLNQMGISSNNINQVGNLIGGAGEGNPIASLIQLQTQRIKDKLAGRTQPSVDATGMAGYDTLVNDAVGKAGQAETKYKQMITDFVGVLRMLIKELMDLENEIAKMDVPTNFNLSDHEQKIRTIIANLNTITDDPNDIAKAYAASLIADLNDTSKASSLIQTGGKNKSRYQYGGAKQTPLLAVELRQLAQLLNINPNVDTDKQKVLNLFKTNETDTELTKLTNTDAKSVVSDYVSTKLLDRLKESASELGVADVNVLNIEKRKLQQQIDVLNAQSNKTDEENAKLAKLEEQKKENERKLNELPPNGYNAIPPVPAPVSTSGTPIPTA